MPGEKLKISPVHVAASVAGTVTVSFVMSFLGDAGTLIGLVVGSALSTTFPTVLEHVGHRSTSAVTKRYKQLRARDVPAQTAMIMARREQAARRRISWQPLAISAALVLALGAGAITVAEASAGKPVSDIVRGQQGSGYTFHTEPAYSPPALPTAPSTTIPVSTSPVPGTSSASPTPSPAPDPTAPLVVPSPTTSPPASTSPAMITPTATPSASDSGVIP